MTEGYWIIGGSFRVTLVVDWWFLPKILGRWWGPTKAIYRSVNADRVIILFAGGGDTWTEFCTIELVWTFCTERWWGAKNLNLWSGKLVGQINLYGKFFVGLLRRGKHIWDGDSIWRWWGHPTTIFHNQNYLHLLPSVAVGTQKQKLLVGQINLYGKFIVGLLRRSKHIWSLFGQPEWCWRCLALICL